jgi:hypothetical protein
MLKLSIARLRDIFPALSWRSVLWSINGFFLLMTVIVGSLPDSGSPNRQGMIKYLAQFTLAEEKNLATYWEGWCLLLASVLAFEQFLRSKTSVSAEKQAWLGLSALATGLSLDELGSIHERAPLLFSSWGLSSDMSSKIPLAVPALLILIFTLHRMWYHTSRRHFWLTLSAFLLFGSVAFQEHLEHALTWPWWARGLRFGVEEGTELVAVFLLLSVVIAGANASGKVESIRHLAPRGETLIALRPVVAFVALLCFIPLALFTLLVITDAPHRGIPAAWLPFTLLNLAGMAAWACAEMGGVDRKRFFLAASLALFFALDQILVFQRVIDKNLTHGSIGNLMLPCMAAVCMTIPILRTRSNMLLLAALLPLSLLLIPTSEVLPWLVVPLQSLGIFWVLVSGLVAIRAAPPPRLLTGVMGTQCYTVVE